ncbi:hypothetical protein PGT21_033497 [Puccinia graminis f. sp. tritici]|uniref:Uncharacterized protein n=1 Tax=Puccinia graminis f. sp. tritici TaxID=56615 RepID=A0A5B0S5P2_PUCGR|nr:hypothetical protein PGT21_033497 [Puccinia graminis f. sp. tritici]KAA1133210.1 hypothetical protein PGTUg99_026668 [Puccinia graminis f. sp. tritici]
MSVHSWIESERHFDSNRVLERSVADSIKKFIYLLYDYFKHLLILNEFLFQAASPAFLLSTYASPSIFILNTVLPTYAIPSRSRSQVISIPPPCSIQNEIKGSFVDLVRTCLNLIVVGGRISLVSTRPTLEPNNHRQFKRSPSHSKVTDQTPIFIDSSPAISPLAEEMEISMLLTPPGYSIYDGDCFTQPEFDALFVEGHRVAGTECHRLCLVTRELTLRTNVVCIQCRKSS